jgi:hypothetical protein
LLFVVHGERSCLSEGYRPKVAELLTNKYESFNARLKTFESYEKNNGKVSDNYILDLVEAGFYYSLPCLNLYLLRAPLIWHNKALLK